MNLSIDIMAKFMPYFLTLRNGILKLTTLPLGELLSEREAEGVYFVGCCRLTVSTTPVGAAN